MVFEPTFHQWQGQSCRGFRLHVTDRAAFKPYATTLALLRAVLRLHPGAFAWRQPPYEHDTERLPLDLLAGDVALREALERGVPVPELEAAWQGELADILVRRRPYRLYSQ